MSNTPNNPKSNIAEKRHREKQEEKERTKIQGEQELKSRQRNTAIKSNIDSYRGPESDRLEQSKPANSLEETESESDSEGQS